MTGFSELYESRLLLPGLLECRGISPGVQQPPRGHDQGTRARQNFYFLGRLRINSWGWFHSELGDVAHAVEYDQESTEIGRTHSIANVEISALINLGLDYLALGQPERAESYLAPTLDRVEREAFGSHRWRWKIRLCIGLAELSYTTGDYDQALRYVEEGLKEAQATSSQKYVALGWALRGKIVAKLGDTDAAGTELQRAFSLAEQLQSPSLLYPIAYDLGHWYETQERNGRQQHCMAKPKPLSSRWQRLWRMRRCAPPSCNRHWCKKFTNGLHGWASNTP